MSKANPRYANGAEIAYSVVELNTPSGYTTRVEGSAAAGFFLLTLRTYASGASSGESALRGWLQRGYISDLVLKRVLG